MPAKQSTAAGGCLATAVFSCGRPVPLLEAGACTIAD